VSKAGLTEQGGLTKVCGVCIYSLSLLPPYLSSDLAPPACSHLLFIIFLCSCRRHQQQLRQEKQDKVVNPYLRRQSQQEHPPDLRQQHQKPRESRGTREARMTGRARETRETRAQRKHHQARVLREDSKDRQGKHRFASLTHCLHLAHCMAYRLSLACRSRQLLYSLPAPL
jgi:hypothetical protein